MIELINNLGTGEQVGVNLITIMILFQAVKQIPVVKAYPQAFLIPLSILVTAGYAYVAATGTETGLVFSSAVLGDWVLKGIVQSAAAAKIYEAGIERFSKPKPQGA